MDALLLMRIHDRVGGAIVPMVVVLHALRSARSVAGWRLMDLRASGNVEPLFPGGILRLEAALPRDVDWLWLERLALLLEDVETVKFMSVTSADESVRYLRGQLILGNHWSDC